MLRLLFRRMMRLGMRSMSNWIRRSKEDYRSTLGRSLHQAIGRICLPMRRRYIYPLEAIDST
jgi:ABC-type sulfate transport system permease component